MKHITLKNTLLVLAFLAIWGAVIHLAVKAI